MRLTLLATALMFCATQADAAVEVFRASGGFSDGSILSGTVSIDTAAGTLEAVDLTVAGPDGFHATDFYTFGDPGGPPDPDGFTFGAFDPTSLSGIPPFANQFVGIIDSDLVGYRGGVIYSLAAFTAAGYNSDYCTYSQPNCVGLAQGTLVAIPEPVTWASLVSGFGLVGAGPRRRRVALAGPATAMPGAAAG